MDIWIRNENDCTVYSCQHWNRSDGLLDSGPDQTDGAAGGGEDSRRPRRGRGWKEKEEKEEKEKKQAKSREKATAKIEGKYR